MNSMERPLPHYNHYCLAQLLHRWISYTFNIMWLSLPWLSCHLHFLTIPTGGIARPTLMWGGEYYRDIAGVARLHDGIIMG